MHFYKFRRPTPISSHLYATKVDMRFFFFFGGGQAEKFLLNMRFPLKMRFMKTSTQTVQTTLRAFSSSHVSARNTTGSSQNQYKN